MNKVENIHHCDWLYERLDIDLDEGQELTTDAEDAIDAIMNAITVFDASEICWYYKDLSEEEIDEVIDRYGDKLWDEEGNVRLKRWRAQITDHADNRGCANWLEYDNRYDAEERYEELRDMITIIDGDARFELVEVDCESGMRITRVIEHS
jgi:dephospho-CoA kinase